MKLFALIGYPLGHSISPAMHNAALPALGIDARYEAWSTPPEGVSAAVGRLREDELLGMNVTVPHKEAVIELLDEVDATAKAIGAVNCISKEGRRLVGHNTDMYGFIRSLREAGCEPRGRRVLILGAGGSARAVANGLLDAGAASLTLSGRTAERAEALANDVLRSFPRALVACAGWQDEGFAAAVLSADMIVNCTPVGQRHTETEGESPLPAPLLRPGLWVYDLVYNPLETPLLAAARATGANPIAGLEMLVYQAAESLRLWTGREPPIDIMRDAAQRALEA
jgi:shikimate dehydrogenase